MRLLAISDIHDNVEAVRRLRELEANRFDAVVTAGDLGNRAACDILGIMETFACPLLYVLGNHDYDIEYEALLQSTAVHIHNKATVINGYCIA